MGGFPDPEVGEGPKSEAEPDKDRTILRERLETTMHGPSPVLYETRAFSGLITTRESPYGDDGFVDHAIAAGHRLRADVSKWLRTEPRWVLDVTASGQCLRMHMRGMSKLGPTEAGPENIAWLVLVWDKPGIVRIAWSEVSLGVMLRPGYA